MEAAARELGLHDDRILAPVKANEVFTSYSVCIFT